VVSSPEILMLCSIFNAEIYSDAETRITFLNSLLK
jgi:hypothetical protein